MSFVHCPFCECRSSKVTHTYPPGKDRDGKTIPFIRRRRVCDDCQLPFFTRQASEEREDEGTTPLNMSV